jgi:hypothetical protein
MKNQLFVITPVFEDRVASNRLFKELYKSQGDETFVIAVDDGSVREPVEVSSIESAGLKGVVIRLRRNVGHQRAIAVGLNYAAETMPDIGIAVTMDSDGEDIPATICRLTAPLASPETDVVVAKRGARSESMQFRLFYFFYKAVFGLLTGRQIDFGNFMAFKPSAIRRLVAIPEIWIHVAGCVLTSKLRIERYVLDRGPRYADQSKMNFAGLVLHGFRAIMVFANDVLVRVSIACALVAALSVLGIILSVTLKFAGLATPGWFSIALGILVLVLFQTGVLMLTTLMLTGVVRGSETAVEYRTLIEEVVETRDTP